MKRGWLAVLALLFPLVAGAHHVLGRPAYSLNEDSNTPPSMQVETKVGKYYVTFMAFPAFPKPNEKGRVNVYLRRIKDGATFKGKVTFLVRDDRWFAPKPETIGMQDPDDNVYRQGFVFSEAGDYIITAKFQADGEPYTIDFPLRIGNPSPVGPIGLTVIAIVVLLVSVNVIQRRRLQRLQTSRHQAEERG